MFYWLTGSSGRPRLLFFSFWEVLVTTRLWVCQGLAEKAHRMIPEKTTEQAVFGPPVYAVTGQLLPHHHQIRRLSRRQRRKTQVPRKTYPNLPCRVFQALIAHGTKLALGTTAHACFVQRVHFAQYLETVASCMGRSR